MTCATAACERHPGDDGGQPATEVLHWHVDDLRSRLQALIDAGAEPVEEVKDVGGGKLVASVKDADGNVIGLIQPA